MAKKTHELDFKNNHIEHCFICGKALSEDEVITDELDQTWCKDCLDEAISRYDEIIEQMKKEKRQ